MVSPNEGNEVRREGRTGVGASRSTVEPGEAVPKGPWWRSSEASCYVTAWEGNTAGASKLVDVSPKTASRTRSTKSGHLRDFLKRRARDGPPSRSERSTRSRVR